MRHGAKVKLCSNVGCTNKAKKGGVCIRHGAKVNQCSYEGCTNIVVKGGVCVRHGANVKGKPLCSSGGCNNIVVNGGVCRRHGANVKRCSIVGCTNQVKWRGVCRRHGSNPKPQDESTAFSLPCGSAFDETTVSLPDLRTNAASRDQNSSDIPPSVILCQVANYTEV